MMFLKIYDVPEEKKSDGLETRTEVSRVVVKCINQKAMEFVTGMMYFKRTHFQF